MKRDIETHIENFAHQSPHCNRTSKTRNALQVLFVKTMTFLIIDSGTYHALTHWTFADLGLARKFCTRVGTGVRIRDQGPILGRGS